MKGQNMKRKSIIQGFPICVALIFIVLASGCVGPTVRTYRGDKLPKSEVAVIKGWYAYYILGYITLDILEVDTAEVSEPLKATKVEVLPGWHQLVIRSYSWGVIPFEAKKILFYRTVSFNAEAGHEYKLKYRMARLGKWYWDIKDVTTGAIIYSHPWP